MRTRIECCVPQHSLEVALLSVFRTRFGSASVRENPEPFEWTDEADGRCHSHLPLALVRRGPEDLAYVDAIPRRILLRDPKLAGARKRLELECEARGASYEIWTADEIFEDRSVTQVVLVADPSERAEYRASLHDRPESCPPVIGLLADRLFLANLRPVGSGWVARSRLTGIPMAVLCNLVVEPQTRMLVWRPEDPSASQRNVGIGAVEGSGGTPR